MSADDEEITSALPANLDALPRLRGFRLRGLEMTRLESFVDAAFAFAVTMLVIAGQQVPDNAVTLLRAFKNVPAFAASIAILAIFWRGHWLWSRRFGLEDTSSIWISWALIFTMLIYVYPLKLIFGGMFYALSYGSVGAPLAVPTGQGRALFALYAVGFGALSLEILLLNLHAWRRRTALRLNEYEQRLTREQLASWSIPLTLGLASLLLALFSPPDYIAWSGWIYFLLPILLRLRAWRRRRAITANQ
ncbi:MAG TPA: TMEM175 family protein [Chthoniobacterales bacterium]